MKKSDCLRCKYVKGYRRKQGMFSKFNDIYVLPIWLRSHSIDKREEFGNWEADLIIGKRKHGYSNILTFIKRKTRIIRFIKIVKSKHHHHINSSIKKIIEDNNLKVKTLTIIDGLEFLKIGIAAY